MKKTGPPARRENDQVAPEPPGDPDNLVGRISLAKDCVGHHAGLANPIANSAECSPGVLPPLIGEADQDTSSHFGDCVRGRRRKHMHEHQLCPIAGGQACRPIQPLIRQRGEIGRAQNATIFIGPALPARPYCHGGDLPRMLAGSCSASVPPLNRPGFLGEEVTGSVVSIRRCRSGCDTLPTLVGMQPLGESHRRRQDRCVRFPHPPRRVPRSCCGCPRCRPSRSSGPRSARSARRTSPRPLARSRGGSSIRATPGA